MDIIIKLLLVILLYINIKVIVKALLGKEWAFSPIVIFALTVTSQMFTQLIVIYISPCYDNALLPRLLFMMVTCQLAFNYGFRRVAIKSPHNVTYVREFIESPQLYVLLFIFALIGLAPMAYYGSLESVYGGINVVLGILRNIGMVALICSLVILVRNPQKRKFKQFVLFAISFYPIFYFGYFVKGSRQTLFGLFYIMMFCLSLWKAKYIKQISRLFCIIFLVGALLGGSMTEIRRVNNYHEDNSTALSDINYIENFILSMTPRDYIGGMDLGNCAVLMEHIENTFSYNMGLDLWNETIQNYIPQRIVGEDLKNSLKIEFESDYKLNNMITWLAQGSTTTTGYYHAFHAFSYFGFILFYFIGYIMGLLFKRSQTSNFYLVAFLFAMYSLPNTITHGTGYLLSTLEMYFFFLYPLWRLVSLKTKNNYGTKNYSLSSWGKA